MIRKYRFPFHGNGINPPPSRGRKRVISTFLKGEEVTRK